MHHPRNFRDDLPEDVLSHCAHKIGFIASMLAQLNPGEFFQINGNAADGLYFMLREIECDIQEAVREICKGGKK